jgi:uncharacterized protein YraI
LQKPEGHDMNLSTSLLASAAALVITAGTASAATVVATADLHLRSGPGTEYPVIAVIPQGVTVHSENCGPGWCHVDYRGRWGWASRAYLRGSWGHAYSYEYTAPSYDYYGYSGPYYGYGEPEYYSYYSPPVVGFGGLYGWRGRHGYAFRHYDRRETRDFAFDRGSRGFDHRHFAGIGSQSHDFAFHNRGFGGHGTARMGNGGHGFAQGERFSGHGFARAEGEHFGGHGFARAEGEHFGGHGFARAEGEHFDGGNGPRRH